MIKYKCFAPLRDTQNGVFAVVALAAVTAESGATMGPLAAVLITLAIFTFAVGLVAFLYLGPAWIEMRMAEARLKAIQTLREINRRP